MGARKIFDRYLASAIKQMKKFKKKGFIHYICLRGPHQFLPQRQVQRESLEESSSRFFYLVEKIEPDVVSF